ncbi:MAG TPA: LPD25 domain-containing protein [Flavobacterium sp.]|nr:LPD25 domain-containing protein [Flavobacterium sp.]
MSKPVWVQVLWSESDQFKENELMPFIDFEIKAHKTAIKKGYDEGYWKTKVRVLFDDGQSYECRLDLAPSDTHGFEHHVSNMINWVEKHGNKANHPANLYKKNCDFLKSIRWP